MAQSIRSNGGSPPAGEQGSALEGVRVLDFSHVLSGAYCTLLLADYGAIVYKLESPQGGDAGRGWGPPFAGDQASFFLGLNRGKFGISIDLKQPEGIDLTLKLIEKVDVLVENFRPGTMDRLGLGYDSLHIRNPRLIYCSISGYGQTGPSREDPAMDLIVQCSSGLLSITGTEAGEQVRSGHSVTDVTAGMFAVIGILMALRRRDQTGQGQLVDVSMFDGIISAMTSNLMNYLGSGRTPQPCGTGFPTVVPYRVYDAADRGISIAIGTEKLWATLCDAIGRPELKTHPQFESNALRVENRRDLDRILCELFAQRSALEWVATFRAAGIPCSLVNTFPEVVDHPQAVFREMFPTIDHPTAGPHRVTGVPIKLSSSPAGHGIPAPLLGQHTRQVLIDLLKVEPAIVDALISRKIIVEPAATTAPAPGARGLV